MAACGGDGRFGVAFDVGGVVGVDADQAGDEGVREVRLRVFEKGADGLLAAVVHEGGGLGVGELVACFVQGFVEGHL